MLSKIASIRPRDHASARQLVWGFQAIYEELDPKPRTDREIEAILNGLIARLKVQLRPGDKKSINQDLAARLDADGLYDPKSIQQELEKLGRLLLE